MALLTQEKIKEMGFLHVGDNVSLSDKASFYNCKKISIGNNTRIDDFCVLSAGAGGISIGNNIHIAVFTSLIGAGKITLCDFANISSNVSIYSSNDDYSGETLTGATIPEQFKNVHHEDVFIGRHVIIGTKSVILPGVTIEDGVAIGCLSLVKESCKIFKMYAGIPVKCIGDRKKDLLELEEEFLSFA